MRPTLSISIPTYNRAACLELLLNQLSLELPTVITNDVEILISDNCSTDDTPAIIDRFCRNFPSTVVIRNSVNKGADYNIEQCFARARGTYVWIFGDDDLLKPGAIGAVLTLLAKESPDLMYLDSTPVQGDLGTIVPDAVQTTLAYTPYDRLAFAKKVNIQFTFISGVITNKEKYLVLRGDSNTSAYQGTSLIQLEWAFSTLLGGDRFFVIDTSALYSRTHSSGGYKLFEVFSLNYFRILDKAFQNHAAIKAALVHRTLIGYLPWLIWTYRFASLGDFSREPFLDTVRAGTSRYAEFWLFLLPIGVLPKPLARLFYLASRAVNKLIRSK